MNKHEEDESWEAEAHASFSVVADSEFKRFTDDLKRKAGILPPLPVRIKNAAKRLLERIKGTCRQLIG